MLEKWYFPPALSEIVGQYGSSNRDFQGSTPVLNNLLRLARHVIMMTEYNFHPTKPATFWLTGTDLPAVEVDFEQIISEVRDSVSGIESSFA